MTPRRRGRRRAVIVTALAVVAVGCGTDDATTNQPSAPGSASDPPAASPPEEPVTIRMGWGIPGEEIKYLMMQRPELAAGLGTWYEIEWHEFTGTPPGVHGLATGTLDCATVGGLSVANGIEQGADIVLLGEMVEERTIEEQTGLVAGDDYDKVEVPFGQMQETLLSGRVDVGLFPQPFYTAINATGEVAPIFQLTDQLNEFVQLLNGCRRDFVDEHPAAVEKFQDDWFAIADWIADPANRADVVTASAAAIGMPADMLDGYLLSEDDYFRPTHGVVNTDALQHEWDFFLERGGLTEPLTVDEHVVPELLSP